MTEEYLKEPIMEKVLNSESEAYRNLNTELKYHQTLWMIYMEKNVSQKVLLRAFPGFDDLSYLEEQDYKKTAQVEQRRLEETGNTL